MISKSRSILNTMFRRAAVLFKCISFFSSNGGNPDGSPKREKDGQISRPFSGKRPLVSRKEITWLGPTHHKTAGNWILSRIRSRSYSWGLGGPQRQWRCWSGVGGTTSLLRWFFKFFYILDFYVIVILEQGGGLAIISHRLILSQKQHRWQWLSGTVHWPTAWTCHAKKTFFSFHAW